MMSRTTLDIDTPILDEVKRLQKEEGESLGQVVSRLLGEALRQRSLQSEPAVLEWSSQPMRASVDLTDKDELYARLDESRPE